MADLKVEVVEVLDVDDHPNADRLSVATVYGYGVITGKDEFQPGDPAIYFPVFMFEGTKMKLNKHRVKAAKIRGIVSQGLLLSLEKLMDYEVAVTPFDLQVGTDITKELGVTKFEPPVKAVRDYATQSGKAPALWNNPAFKKYTKIQHLKRYHTAFKPGESVIVTEKIHGTNFRAGWVPRKCNNFIDRFRVKLGKSKWALIRALGLDEFEFVFGSHNVQLQSSKANRDNAYHGNVYERAVEKFDLRWKIPFAQVWFMEIFGPGIQAEYDYGLDEIQIRVFDIQSSLDHTYFNFDYVDLMCFMTGLPIVPNIQVEYNTEQIDEDLNADGGMNSGIDPATKIEGLVIRSVKEESHLGVRKVLKWISDAYLLKKGMTDNH
jgi:RNA ligase (TIGR02306 family)